jgi:hypothetical protein
LKNLRSPIATFLGPRILAALMLAAVLACQSPAATPAALSPTGTPAPALPTSTSVPAGSLDNVAMLLTWLPTDRSQVWFVEFGKVSQRASQQDHGWEDELLLLVNATNEVLDFPLVKSAGITSAAFSVNSSVEGVAILLGDFSTFPEVLREAAATGAATLYTYRELELFAFTDHYDLYLAVPDSDTLLLAQGDGALPRQLLEETIDRRLDGAELDETLARLLMETGPIDFLAARYPETEEAAPGFPRPRFTAGAGMMNEGDTSTLHLYFEFANAVEAERAESQMTGQDLHGYNSGERYPITGIRRDGETIIAQGVVLDTDVGGLLLGN